jgi:hypothetical protein
LNQFADLAPFAGKIGLIPALMAPADAPTITLPADELAAYAGRYADPGLSITVAAKGEELELSLEHIDQPGAWTATIQPPTAPPAPIAFLAKDMAVIGGGRVPFVRDAAGHVQWVSLGLRLVPRVEGRA